MKVALVSYTRDAKELLLLTKETRREMSCNSMEELLALSEEEKDAQLKHVFRTISGPWEFIDYVFLIEGVTRAFTHQMVRHRVGTSFAQQSQRMPTVKGQFDYLASGKAANHNSYHDVMKTIGMIYQQLLDDGVAPQDARGVLPTNIHTAIVCKFNLRSLNTLMNSRLCVRTQGEFQQVAKLMRQEVLRVHPFAEGVLLPFCLEWGVCRFPDFKDCPIKKAHPHLGKNDALINSAAKTWEAVVGKTGAQPS